MKQDIELIEEVIELYEYHRDLSLKYSNILGILRGTPKDNPIKKDVKKPLIKFETTSDRNELLGIKPELGPAILWRTCANPDCNKSFETHRKDSKYCSKKCYQHCYLKTYKPPVKKTEPVFPADATPFSVPDPDEKKKRSKRSLQN